MTVVEFDVAKPAVVKKPPTALTATQTIIREWMPHLSASEFVVVMVLLDRTLGWQKTRATFSLDRVLNGDKIYSGMSNTVSRRSLFRALARLELKGMIARHHHPEGKQIKVSSVNLGWSSAMLNVPERLKTGAAVTLDQCQAGTGAVPQWHTRESNPGEGSLENENYAEPASQRTIDPSELIREAREEVSARRKPRPAAKIMKLKDRVDAAQAQWRAAISEVHPTGAVLTWNVREVHMVKNKAKGWLHTDRITFPDFIGWCARSWASVCRTQLSWMTKSSPPKTPNIGFLVSFIDHFADAWAGGDLDAWMNEDQRTVYDKLVASGHSHDEALHEMSKREAVSIMRDENRKVTTDANQKLREADLKVKRAERLENMPIHPRSPLAQRIRQGDAVNPPPRTRIRTEEDLKAIDWGNMPVLDPNWEPL
ncbi:hypothetical protein KK137_00045 [Croceibacterium sp. LX-88]|uniref:Replication protein n=1 Tax=Croceibacterium selenioxidans TaxID=2838833 RepID=A0ABS5VZ99_9SPHN|nr:hypothetical protein [Croceibacterium selenioxidans]MBT2132709.1 hypothetical protein [Croceibacterium selenioxidans]